MRRNAIDGKDILFTSYKLTQSGTKRYNVTSSCYIGILQFIYNLFKDYHGDKATICTGVEYHNTFIAPLVEFITELTAWYDEYDAEKNSDCTKIVDLIDHASVAIPDAMSA